MLLRLPVLFLMLLVPGLARAAGVYSAPPGLAWGIPFAGILLSIALFPMFAPAFWHHHFGKITLGWTLVFLLPFAAVFGLPSASALTMHALLAEYVPFIVLLLSLYTVSGGILVEGNLHGSPARNTAILALGTVLASLMGTTGAAMVLIRPLLRANDNRQHKVHVVVFFIFLVANIGGGLTPLGDPPLFLGFLNGVGFGWTFLHMLAPVTCAAIVLLVLFYLVDRHFYRKEGVLPRDPTPDTPSFRLRGLINLPLLLMAVLAVLQSGLWQGGVAFVVAGTEVLWPNLIRDTILLATVGLSLWLTPAGLRAANDFTWAPILEVVKLFGGIFLTIAPVITILRAGTAGDLGALVGMVTGPDGRPHDAMYFWMTGILSSFLDNAPTYLVFFNLAAGDATVLTGPLSSTLLAISMGAVFMGANSYIGNAPNFMVKAIAEHGGVRMPGFFAYMLWSGAILMPLFALLTVLFFQIS